MYMKYDLFIHRYKFFTLHDNWANSSTDQGRMTQMKALRRREGAFLISLQHTQKQQQLNPRLSDSYMCISS